MTTEQDVKAIMGKYGVSRSSAERWIKRGLQRSIDRHIERQRLREECARNGVPMSVAHQRKWEGWPADALAMPLKGREVSP